MSDRVSTKGEPPTEGQQSANGDKSTKGQPLVTAQPTTKAQKRAIAKAVRAASVAAEARHRRLMSLAGASIAFAVLAACVVVYLVYGNSEPTHVVPNGTPAAAPVNSAAAADPQQASPPALPPGSDPALGTEPKVTAGTGTLTKLAVKTLIKGTGATVTAGQTITVNYVGVTYKDGTLFDASWTQGQPATFQIGAGKVIPGWDQGLVGVKVGSRVQLDIPSSLGYGDNPTNGAPAGALRFVVDILAAQ